MAVVLLPLIINSKPKCILFTQLTQSLFFSKIMVVIRDDPALYSNQISSEGSYFEILRL